MQTHSATEEKIPSSLEELTQRFEQLVFAGKEKMTEDQKFFFKAGIGFFHRASLEFAAKHYGQPLPPEGFINLRLEAEAFMLCKDIMDRHSLFCSDCEDPTSTDKPH